MENLLLPCILEKLDCPRGNSALFREVATTPVYAKEFANNNVAFKLRCEKEATAYNIFGQFYLLWISNFIRMHQTKESRDKFLRNLFIPDKLYWLRKANEERIRQIAKYKIRRVLLEREMSKVLESDSGFWTTTFLASRS